MLLSPVGWLYRKIAGIRIALYERGMLRSHDLGAKTISIGNITFGGTGKTPLVAHVAVILADAGDKVCILTRGYGRESSGRVLVSDGEQVLVDARAGGDEPVELARKLIGKAIIVADADRVDAAGWAKQEYGVTAFVLDDGFQHRRAKRDLDIVCIDATDPFGRQLSPPAFSLREPAANLARADAIVLTRCDLVDSIDAVIDEVESLTPQVPIFRAETRLIRLNSLDAFLDRGNQSEQHRTAAGSFAFCGLGNPRPFIDMLTHAGIKSTNVRAFPDHVRYTQADINEIQAEARTNGCDALVTTGKDAVKLNELKLDMQCFVAEVEIVVNDPEAFRRLVLSV